MLMIVKPIPKESRMRPELKQQHVNRCCLPSTASLLISETFATTATTLSRPSVIASPQLQI